MYKYSIGDIVETKYGVARIEKIWELNDIITVFRVYILQPHVKKEIFYGEIDKILYKGC